jgi:hypothetical protein
VLIGGYDNSDNLAVPAYLYQPAEDIFATGGLNGVFPVTSIDSALAFKYSTPNYPGLTTNSNALAVIKPLAAVAGGNITGPFTFDPINGVAITGTETEATMDLFSGQQYQVLDVTDATAFPDAPGYLVINFGSDTSVAPVKYLGRLSDTALILDYSFKFPEDNPTDSYSIASAARASNVTTLTLNLEQGQTSHSMVVGQKIYLKSTSGSFSSGYKTISAKTNTTITFADPGANTSIASIGTVIVKGPTVTLLAKKGLYVPAHPEKLGASYITASSAGRTAAVKSVKDSVAAGIDTTVEVIYPGDKGLGGAGLPASGQTRLSDKVAVWGGDDLNTELATARGEE